jgi:hypothetical protein
MPKLTYDEVLQALADEQFIKSEDVRADVLRRRVWLMMYSAPGCLPDHREVCTTKAQAIESAVTLYADDAPRGFATALRRDEIAATDASGYYRVELSHVQIRELF